MMGFKPGDTVRIIKDDNGHKIPIGSIVTIRGYYRGGSPYKGDLFYVEEHHNVVRDYHLELVRNPDIIL
jgi:hypothetical protein